MFESERTDVGQKVNAFVLVGSKPYLLGYYLNNYRYTALDPSVLSNGIAIDTSVDGQALITINIDQTKKAGDGTPLLTGNAEKREELEQAVMARREVLAHQRFPVIKKGLVVRINYRLENQRTGVPIKSVTEDFKVYDSGFNFFSEGVNAADPALVVNFSDSVIASVNQFTHGVDPVVLRVNTVHLYYEAITPNVPKPKPPRGVSLMTFGYPVLQPPCDCKHLEDPRFKTINNLYRFGSDNSDIFLNQSEIDLCKRVELIECGAFYLNKAFVVSPVQRILFKVSVWKDDLVVVADTYRIANILGIYAFDTFNKAQSSFANSVVQGFEDQRIDDCYRDQLIASLQAQINELKGQMPPVKYITSKPKPMPPETYRVIKKCNCDHCTGKCHCGEVPPPPPPPEHYCHCHDFEEDPFVVHHRPRPFHKHNLFVEDLERIVDEHMD